MTSGVEISRRLVVINAASTVLRKVIVVTVLVWLHQHLVRRISAQEYALYPVLMALMVFFPLLTTTFTAGLRRYVTEAYAQGDERRVTQLVSTMAPLLIGVGGLLLIVGWVCAWFIGNILTIAPGQLTDARTMFALLIFSASLRVVLTPFGLGFFVRQKFVLRNVIGLGTEVLRVLLLLALLSISTRVLWVVVAMVTANLAEMLVVTVVSRRLLPALRFRPSEIRRSEAGPLLSFGGWSVTIQIAMLIREAADPLILNKLSTARAVTSFSLGAMLDGHIRRTYLEAYGTVLPAVTAMEATGQKDRLRRTYFRLTRYSLWLLLLPAIPLILYRDEVFQLYLRERYADYAAAAFVLALLMARAVVIFPNSILGMIASAKAMVRPIAIRACTISAANLALTLYLVGVRNLGAVGSALATLIVTVIGAPLLFWTLGLRMVEARAGAWLRASVLPGLVPAAVATPAWIGAGYLVSPQTWLGLLTVLALGAVVYAVVLLGFAVRPEDRSDIKRALARLRGGGGDASPVD